MTAKRLDPPRRQRAARADASIKTIERHIEKTYGLPSSSVNVSLPSGRNARDDKRIRALRSDYEK